MIGILASVTSIITFLSLAGAFTILVYLLLTESMAPRFIAPTGAKLPEENGKPVLSIIVTARNEEQMIENCLNSLSAQSFENLEVIVIDDSSTDRTSEIVRSIMKRDGKLRLVEAGQKPKGWVGKSWPCWRGFEEARGEFLLFVDADSTFEATIVERCIAHVKDQSIDMFSISPRIIVHSIWAKTVLPLISAAINLLYPMEKVNDKKSGRAYVFGTFILVRKSVYEKTGGHKSVRDQIVEDAAIAQMVKSAGFNLRIEKGPEYLSTEWENDLLSIFNGLERITSTSIKTYGLKSILNAIFLFFLMLYPILFLLFNFAFRNFNGVIEFGEIACALNIVVFVSLDAFEMRTVTGNVDFSILLYSLGSAIFITAIITTSLKLARGRGINWKGQGYNQSLGKARVSE